MVHRTFFAINLPNSLKHNLSNFFETLKRLNKNQKITWVNEENLHLTLHFLGNKNDEELIKINEIAENVSKDFSSFEICTGNFGCFPNQFRPRIIFLELSITNILKNLVQKLGENLAKAGFEIDNRPWRAHITIGRAKEDLTNFKFLDKPFNESKFVVNSFELMDSELTAQGPIYKILNSYHLV